MHARLELRVSPGSSRPGIVGRHGTGRQGTGRHGTVWKVRVAAAPEGGKANAAVMRLLAATLAVPARDVAIVSGHGSRDKTVALRGIDGAEIERRLAAASRQGREST